MDHGQVTDRHALPDDRRQPIGHMDDGPILDVRAIADGDGGDIAPITIGDGTNIQDGAVVHVADRLPAVIGQRVTVGHLAMIHACTIGDECLIGMHATILDSAVIGARCIIGAGALVTKGTIIPAGSMVLGSPAKVVRALTAAEQASLPGWAEKYVKVAAHHRRFE